MPAYAWPSSGSPTREEIANCAPWWRREFQLVRPRLVIPVGQLAIARFLMVPRLDAVVGQRLQTQRSLDTQGSGCQSVTCTKLVP